MGGGVAIVLNSYCILFLNEMEASLSDPEYEDYPTQSCSPAESSEGYKSCRHGWLWLSQYPTHEKNRTNQIPHAIKVEYSSTPIDKTMLIISKSNPAIKVEYASTPFDKTMLIISPKSMRAIIETIDLLLRYKWS